MSSSLYACSAGSGSKNPALSVPTPGIAVTCPTPEGTSPDREHAVGKSWSDRGGAVGKSLRGRGCAVGK